MPNAPRSRNAMSDSSDSSDSSSDRSSTDEPRRRRLRLIETEQPRRRRLRSIETEQPRMRRFRLFDLKQPRDDCTVPEFPDLMLKTSSKKETQSNFGFLTIFGAVFLTYVVYICVIVALMAKSLSDSAGVIPRDFDGLEFALYKNSRFEECYNSDPHAECDRIEQVLRGEMGSEVDDTYTADGLGKLASSHFTIALDDEPEFAFGWCDAVSCLNRLKILPSKPLPAAFSAPAFNSLCFELILFSSVTWQVRLRVWGMLRRVWPRSRPRNRPCRRWRDIGVVDSVIVVYDFCGPFAWWWVRFFHLIADRAQVGTLSILAWVAMWRSAMDVRYHPYSCVLPRRVTQIAQWTFYILAFLQLGACLYVQLVDSWDNRQNSQVYTCLPSQIASSPGTLSPSCTADKVCSETPLFLNQDFWGDSGVYRDGQASIVNRICALVVIGLPVVFYIMEVVINGWKLEKPSWTLVATTMRLGLIMLTVTIAFAQGLVVNVILSERNAAREGLVLIDWECGAVHVGLSPWRWYIDVNGHNVLELVQAWFTG